MIIARINVRPYFSRNEPADMITDGIKSIILKKILVSFFIFSLGFAEGMLVTFLPLSFAILWASFLYALSALIFCFISSF